jgi:paraquat-inducible protein B
MVRFNQAPNDFAMPVVIELEQELLRRRLREPSEAFNEKTLPQRIERGLRASLQTESLVTGVLYIDIRFNPNAPRPIFHQLVKDYPELPTEPTQIQQLMSNLASLDIKGIEINLNAVLTRLDTMISELQMAEISRGITNMLLSVDRLVSSPEITNDLVAVRTTLDQYRALGEHLDSRIDPLADNLSNSLAQANSALAQVRGAAENLRTLLAPDAPLPNNLDEALQQLSGAVQSLSVFLDFLKQHPNALITGREARDKKP